MIAATVAAPHAQDAASAVSVDRVRTALERPPSKLTLAERKPDFSITVVWHHPFHEIFDTPPWATPKVGWQPPGLPAMTAFGTIPILNVDLLAFARSASGAKHDRDERAAQADVQRAIADYCAAQPNANAIQLCSTTPAIR